MDCKKGIFILILAVFLMSMAGVSASEANDTLLASENDAGIELTATENDFNTINDNTTNNGEILSAADETAGVEDSNDMIDEGSNSKLASQNTDDDFLKADALSLTQLYYAVNNGADKVDLNNNYAYSGPDDIQGRIPIQRAVTIDGHGITIDGANSAGIFYVEGNVIFKNINFKNCWDDDGGGGAAIFIYSGNCQIINCNFENNSALAGGAVYSYADCKIINCGFDNNRALESGGAVYSSLGDCNLVNCGFNNNHANSGSGGAVQFEGTGSLVGCNFTNNSAEFGGGAAAFDISPQVINCSFDNNSALNGGALLFERTGSVSGCNFTNNSAKSYGGAIRFLLNATVIDSNFINNSAKSDGGAILFIESGNAYNCNFISNGAKDGGAIYFHKSASDIYVNSTFVSNHATRGGAIYFYFSHSDGNIAGIYTQNDARVGSAIYSLNSMRNFDISGNFLDNVGESTIHFVTPVSNVTVHDSIFINNGYGIYSSYGSVNVVNSWFGNNASNYDEKPNTVGVEFDNWLFLNAMADLDSVPFSKTGNVTFKLDSYASGNVESYDNSRLIPVNLTLNAVNANLDKDCIGLNGTVTCVADGTGVPSITASLINAYYTFEVELREDSKLNVTVNPQEINYGGNATVILDYNPNATGNVNITFIGKRYNRTIENVDLNQSISVSMLLPDEYEITVSYSGDENFKNAIATAPETLTVNELHLLYVNASAADGGIGSKKRPFNNLRIALDFAQDGDNIMIAGGERYSGEDNVNFEINKKLNFSKYGDGEAIFDAQGKSRIFTFYASDINITGLTFKNGSSENGGAIYFNNFATLVNCNFADNHATSSSGGAVYFRDCGSVDNCNFTFNSADYGGAIRFNGTSNVTNCSFENNYANIGGGAVYVYSGDCRLINCSFDNNYVDLSGGAVCVYSGDCRLISSSFDNNYANYSGGAVQVNSGDYKLINCSFDNNSALELGGAVFLRNCGSVDNCNFTFNSAYYGGAIRFNGTSNVTNCNFDNNSALAGGAVCVYSGDCQLISSSFDNNYANVSGGAVHVDSGDCKLINCSFDNNSALELGGAVYLRDCGSVENCNFTFNSADYGGAIYFANSTSDIYVNSTFIGNNATLYGGAIFFDASYSDGIIAGIYAHNDALVGSAIFFRGSLTSFDISGNFLDNGGNSVIHFLSSSSDVTVHDSIFINNGYDIYDYSTSVKAVNSWFGNNASNYDEKPNTFGVEFENWLFLNATADQVSSSKADKITFKLDSYASGNVESYDNSRLIPVNLTLNAVNANLDKDSIGLNGTVTCVANCTGISSITASLSYAHYTFEVELREDSKLNVTVNPQEINYGGNATVILDYNPNATGNVNITFIGKRYNRAIENVDLNQSISVSMLLPDEYEITVSYSGDENFKNAIATAPETLTVNELHLLYVNASAEDGGIGSEEKPFNNLRIALDFAQDGDNIMIAGGERYSGEDNVNFEINKKLNFSKYGDGEAIFDAQGKSRIFTVHVSGITITGLTFKNGYADGNGGAIYFSDEGTVINCNFINNTALNGGAIYFYTSYHKNHNPYNIKLTNCDFTNNKVSGDGGAIYFSDSHFDFGFMDLHYLVTGDVSNCDFTNNVANRGGAIFSLSPFNIGNCNFTGNNATGGSAIFLNVDSDYDSSTNTVSDSIFLNNRANAEVLQVTKNKNNITITFTGNDNLINAIYSDVGSNCDVRFTNVTYWGANGIANTNSYAPSLSNNEAGQNITVEIYDFNDNLVENVTLVTDENGQVTHDFIKQITGGYKYKTYHGQDYYYTYKEDEGIFILGLGDFNILQKYINEASENSILTLYRDYTFTIGADENLTDGIVIDKQITINGNGHTINAQQKARIFHVNADNVVLTNITFANATTSGDGGAIYFEFDGTVINCNFTNNAASNGGAVYIRNQGTVINCNFIENKATGYSNGNEFCGGGAIRMDSGSVTNCNFTNNTASNAGAVYFIEWYNVTNCNFVCNQATGDSNDYWNCGGGAIFFNSYSHGTVINCNFIENKATGVDGMGGAIYFEWFAQGTVINYCNFTGNNASAGSAIHFEYDDSSTKKVSNSIFLNNRANAESLEVTKNENNIIITFTGKDNLLNAIYSDSDVDFSNVTYWGANGIANTDSYTPSKSNKEAGQNITVCVVVYDIVILNEVKVTDENGTIVLGINAGENYLISARHYADSYYTGNEKIIQKRAYNVNVMSQTSYNRTVNITAKSDICGDVMTGKLLFVLPNGDEINATYAADGIWWAEHTFDEYEDYQISASYIGLDNVAVNNATISIVKANSTVNVTDTVLYYGQTNITAITEGADEITAKIGDKNATVIGNTIIIPVMDVGNYTLTVTTIPDGDHISVTEPFKITVNKALTEIILTNETMNLKVNESVPAGATLTPADAGNLNYTSSNSSVVEVENGYIMAAGQGQANVTVSFGGNKNYAAAVNKTITVTVSLKDASVNVNNATLDLFVGGNFTIVATTDPVDLDVSFESSNASVADVDVNGVVTALKEGTASIIVKVGDGKVYALNSTEIAVNVSKVPTEISVISSTGEMSVGAVAHVGAELIPSEAGKLTYASNDTSVVNVSSTGVIKANKAGTALITVSFNGNGRYAAAESKNITVTVSLKPASVSVNNASVDLFVGDNFTIVADTLPAGLNVTFVQDDSGVYIVDENGLVIALKNGTGNVLVKVGGDGVFAENSTEVSVTVSKIPTEISVISLTGEMSVGAMAHVGVELIPSEAGNLTYVSNDTSVVSVSSAGVIKANNVGIALITVSFAGDDRYAAAESKNITVTVSLNDASVSVNNETLELFVGDNFTIVATTNPLGLNVTFVQDDSGVYLVDDKGVVTALKNGTGNVLVKVGGDGVYAENSTEIAVTVSKIPTEISVISPTGEMSVGAMAHVGAELIPSEAGKLTYTSNDTSVVNVSSTGVIKANNAGTALITVSFTGNDRYAAAESKNITVTVSLKDASVSVNNATLELFVGDNFTIVADTLPAGLNVTFIPDNSGVISVDENGVVIALKNGTATIMVKVGGDGIYAENSTNVTVNVSKMPTEIIVQNATFDMELFDRIIANDTLMPMGAGNLTYTSNDESVIEVYGHILFAIKEGNATVTVSFNGNDRYAAAESKSIFISVRLIDASVNVENDTVELEIDENYVIVATTTPKDLDVIFTSSNESVTTVDENGTVTAIGKGTATITVTINETAFANNSTTVTVNVKDNAISVSAPDVEKYYGGNESFVVTVTDSQGNPLANKTVEITLNGAEYNRTTDADGMASIALNLNSGVYNVTATVDNVGVNSTITVKSTVNADDFVKVFRNATQFYAEFKDSEGNYLAKGTVVSFNINGVFYNRTVEENGRAKLNINLEQGNYIITSINTVTGENAANNVTVIARLVENSDLVKYYRNASQYTVKVIGDDGKPVGAGETVSFNVNGVLYNRTTDESGIATLNINLHPGDYIITAEYKDCRVSNNITVLPVLNATDLTKKYGTSDQFVVNLVNGTGAPYAEQIVSFNINGVFYNGVTDSAGQAKLNINLMPGEYIITSSYNGTNIANKVTVRS